MILSHKSDQSKIQKYVVAALTNILSWIVQLNVINGVDKPQFSAI
jgi:hypothetical protein